MDLVKIGKYIAEKRKALGMTQKQLAEQLGMSDKSVSKWERGVCLPDVSVYLELCKILGITINEFLAGEDISEENLTEKSEDNLIQVAKDSKHRQKHLKGMIAVLALTAVLAIAATGVMWYRSVRTPKNFIAPYSMDSPEMNIARILSGPDGAMLFQYSADETFRTMTLYLTEYHYSEQVSKTEIAGLGYDDFSDVTSMSKGMIALIPDFETFQVDVYITDSGCKYQTKFPILENVENREVFGRSGTEITEDTALVYDKELGLGAFFYGENGLSAYSVEDLEKRNVELNNEYTYYVSVEFSK